MSSGSNIRTRSERAAALRMESSRWRRWLDSIVSTPALLRIAIALSVVVLLSIGMRGWLPPFSYREGYIPLRAIVARVRFDVPDLNKTAVLRDQKRREVLCLYENRPQALTQLRGALKEQVFRLLGDTKLEALDGAAQTTLTRFVESAADEQTSLNAAEVLALIRDVLGTDPKLERFDQALRAAFQPFEDHGLLNTLAHQMEDGNQRQIYVYPLGRPAEKVAVDVATVRIIEARNDLKLRLREELHRTYTNDQTEKLSELLFANLSTQLQPTLTYNAELSDIERKVAVESVETAKTTYFPGEHTLVRGGRPLTQQDVEYLRAEHEAWLSQIPWSEQVIRLLAFIGMISAFYLLTGLYIYFQFDRSHILDVVKLIRLLALVFCTCILCRWAAGDPWRAEVLPLTVSAFTATIAYGRQFALILLCILNIAITLSLGLGVEEFVLLSAAVCSSILFLGRIRTRTRLIYVGLGAAVITAATTVGVGVMVGETVDTVQTGKSIDSFQSMIVALLWQLLTDASRQGIFVAVAGILMTGLLPFVERVFKVQTDLSLLELGDTSHPLLRQLAQRAPGTFNHSINVAAIAEPAAESIGGNGLLTRVGAYFHDIGKMFKPAYFVENQSGGNRHDTLQPAMSTLVIIAHVKDGADLARQYRLPQPIIDFIEQHHGTTLVEYFYRQAAKKSENDPNAEEVSEQGFRYPGPKPQTLEAAVLMLADAAESASRTLVEPTPARLQGLVDDIAMKRLLDGQFDDCGLTLIQLGQLKKSLVKSLTANYHGRLKYPGQQTA